MAKTKTVLDLSVTQHEDGTWGFQCPGVQGSPCGVPGGPGFASTGWPDREHAVDRGRQHFDEHKGLGVAQELAEFRAERGLGVDAEGVCVKVEDL